MNTRTLVVLVGGVALISFAAFLIVPSIAKNAQDAQFAKFNTNQNGNGFTVDRSSLGTTTGATTNNQGNTGGTSTAGTGTAGGGSTTSVTSFTLADVAEHNSQSSCWTAIDGKVYDLTSFIFQHPGGAANIMLICGIDGTAAFAAQHGSGNRQQQAILQELYIGQLAR